LIEEQKGGDSTATGGNTKTDPDPNIKALVEHVFDCVLDSVEKGKN